MLMQNPCLSQSFDERGFTETLTAVWGVCVQLPRRGTLCSLEDANRRRYVWAHVSLASGYRHALLVMLRKFRVLQIETDHALG
jgi:hypothetical protein